MVFTKFDLLVRKLEREAPDVEDEDQFEIQIYKRAEEIFDETCVRKLKTITRQRKNPIAFVKVSSVYSSNKFVPYSTYRLLKEKPRYKDTLVRLVDETQRSLDSHISILWALAQRASVDAKVDACIKCVLNNISREARSHL